jgi:predicted component of type VI protein secretion system
MAYEPRLSRVRVETGESDAHDMRVSFIISGVVASGERVQLETIFGSQERADVRPL